MQRYIRILCTQHISNITIDISNNQCTIYFVLVNWQTKHKNYNNNQIQPGNYDYVVNAETDNSYVFNIFEQTIPLKDI